MGIDKNKTKDWMISDLHIHSKFSRACSKDLDFPNLVKWARIKGINLLGTGDFSHPKWFEGIKSLKHNGKGFYYYEDFPFIITGEISLIYSDKGKGRKVHLVLLIPSVEIAEKIHAYLDSKGRRDYDGRPIFGIPCDVFTRDMKEISKDIEIIPAHCLLPDSLIHIENSVKKIKDIKIGIKVLTHTGVFKEVKDVLVHSYNGKIYKIIPWYFKEGLSTTPEHPFYIIKSYKKCPSTKGLCKPLCSQVKKGCARKYYSKYFPQWISAKNIEIGDFLVYPRIKEEEDLSKIDLCEYIKDYKKIHENFIISKNARNHTGIIKRNIEVNERFCRLIGYFLSEGYLIKNYGVGFSFHSKEKEYIEEVISVIKESFGFDITKIDSRRENQADLVFSSKLLNAFFSNFYFGECKRANNKFLPKKFSLLPKNKLAEIFRGWWRGDTGTTISRQLANQMKLICLKLGIIPSISIYTIEKQAKRKKCFIKGREIVPRNDSIIFSNLSFFEEDFGMLKESCFKKSINKLNRKHGWMDKDYAYLPIRKIETTDYSGEVYNLEVEENNSYVPEFACVHNCWTPYFGVFGSMSGFDSLKDCFKEQFENIHAIETGISSNPEMNWKIKELNPISILSFSDSHSFWPFRLGREATIFEKTDSYLDLISQIRNNTLIGTIETDPAYGKYHWDGHMNCKFSCSSEKTKQINGICPICSSKLVIGVENRVNELKNTELFKGKDFYTLLPLHEIISLFLDKGMQSKIVFSIYNLFINYFGNEFNVLLNVSKKEMLEKGFDEKLVNLILKNREGKIKVIPGYDGQYGVASLDDFTEKQVTLL